MIVLLRQVILSVTAASLFGAVALALVPDGALKEAIRLGVGIVSLWSFRCAVRCRPDCLTCCPKRQRYSRTRRVMCTARRYRNRWRRRRRNMSYSRRQKTESPVRHRRRQLLRRMEPFRSLPCPSSQRTASPKAGWMRCETGFRQNSACRRTQFWQSERAVT